MQLSQDWRHPPGLKASGAESPPLSGGWRRSGPAHHQGASCSASFQDLVPNECPRSLPLSNRAAGPSHPFPGPRAPAHRTGTGSRKTLGSTNQLSTGACGVASTGEPIRCRQMGNSWVCSILQIPEVLKHHSAKPPRPRIGKIHGKPLDVHTRQQSPGVLLLIP